VAGGGNGGGWLERPKNVTRIVRTLASVCVLLALGDLVYHKHVHFGWEGWFGFYALFGFASFLFIVLAGKQLRKLLMRDEDYYDR